MRPPPPSPSPSSSPPSQPLEAPRRLLALLFFGLGGWYLLWRLGTLNPDAPWLSRTIYAAEVFGFVSALLHVFMCWRLTVREAPPPRVQRTVDVFVPTYNESAALVRKTLLAALAMEQPHTVWLLDDGRREEMTALARELGCRYLTRPDNAHAKAGNLNHALQHSQAELVVVFDCDHAPKRDFLTRTLGYFDDPRVGFVQTPQDFYNLDSYQHRRGGRSRSVWTEQSLFFRVIQRGKDRWNAAFFCGSCAVVRRTALDGIGGFATGTVTEDLHTSIRLHAKGWQSVYHAEPLAFGLAPESIEPFIAQRLRWGQGAMHVWRKEGILTHKGLSWAQRLNYLASVMTYFDGWQKAVMYLAPVIVLTTGTMPLVADTPTFLLHFIPYYALTFWVFEEVGRGYGRSLFIEQYNMARFAAFAWATLAWIFPRMKFRVTPKGAAPGARSWRLTLPQWSVMALNALAIPVGVVLFARHGSLPLDGLVANVVWAAINGGLAAAVLSFTLGLQRHRRADYRFPVPLVAELVFADGSRVFGTADDLSARGLRFYGALPASLAVGQPVTGQLLLPDGPIALWGEVAATFGAGDDEGPRAVGCRVRSTGDGQKRLEAFLFGSDRQWQVNGFTDQIQTPLSRWLPRRVAGPQPHPLADRRWNAAQVHARIDEPGLPALAAAGPQAGSEDLLLSYLPLPTDAPLVLQVFRRTPVPPRGVRLEPLPRTGGDVFVYRLVGVPLPLTRRDDAPDTQPAALVMREAIAQARESAGRDGAASSHDIHPTTL
jgi:cellulose synthase (UDP-forming)